MRSRRIPKKKKMGLRQENNIVKNNQQIILFPINLPVNLLGKKATNISEWKPLFWHLILEICGQAKGILSWKQLVEILPQPWQPETNIIQFGIFIIGSTCMNSKKHPT